MFYLSLALPGDEKAIFVNLHLTVGLEDVRVLQKKYFFYERGGVIIHKVLFDTERHETANHFNTHTHTSYVTKDLDSNSFSKMYLPVLSHKFF